MTPDLPAVASAPHGSLVELYNVEKSFPESGSILEPLRLVIEPGEFVSLLGPSGCGKSTLLRIIAGLEQPSLGEIKSSRLAQGFVFQESHLLPWCTVEKNIRLPLELRKLPRGQIQMATTAAMKRVGLEQAATLFPRQLSGGMKMRVSLARALVTEPRLLLLDEPFAALDEVTRHALQEDLRHLWLKLGMTVIFVTHSVAEAVFLSTRQLVFSPRPARLLLDHVSTLPRERNLKTRTCAEFNREVEMIYAVTANSQRPVEDFKNETA
jgi:NitT/TauT family transport system ATP-binding protein